MNTSLEGSRVLVTAGAAGIGRAIVGLFHEHGARIHICDIDKEALERCRRELPDVTQSVADVSSRADVERLFVDVKRELGGLDVLVNNAGIAGPTAKIEDIAPDDWERCIAIDLSSMFYCTRLAMPLLKANGRERGGSIICLSSAAGRFGYPLRSPYASAKWGVVGFTKSIAAEAGPDGIRVNCILPGYVEGPRIDRVIDAKAKALGITFEKQRENLLATSSLREFVTAADIADMALFLAAPAGRHVSGQALAVDADLQRLG
jgi:NAD(P)-dependent dehydrogenase (short-subunit alcohol dehydrogenase family)